MGANCGGNHYLSCNEANLCCQKGDKKNQDKVKKYKEFIEASHEHMNIEGKMEHERKNMRDKSMDEQQYEGLEDSINILDGSQYYESNGEIICIDNQYTTKSKSKSPTRRYQKVEDLKKVQNIKDFYKISFEHTDLLGNGAFAMVRLCSKVFD